MRCLVLNHWLISEIASLYFTLLPFVNCFFLYPWRSKSSCGRQRRISSSTCHSWRWTESMWKLCLLRAWARLRFWRNSRSTVPWVSLGPGCCLCPSLANVDVDQGSHVLEDPFPTSKTRFHIAYCGIKIIHIKIVVSISRHRRLL